MMNDWVLRTARAALCVPVVLGWSLLVLSPAPVSHGQEAGMALISTASSSTSFDLAVTDVYFRDQPGGAGEVVPDPEVEERLYAHVEFTVAGPESVSARIWSIDVNGWEICTTTTTLSPGAYVAWCEYAVFFTVGGEFTLRGVVDPDDTVVESDEANNELASAVTVTGPPGPFRVTKEAPVCDTSTGERIAAVRLNWEAASGATDYDLYRDGVLRAGGLTGTTFYDMVGLEAGIMYSYLVRARNTWGETDSNTLSTWIRDGLCDPHISIEPHTLDFEAVDASAVQFLGAVEDPYLLHLKNGPFVPQPVSSMAMGEVAGGRHLLVQFEAAVDDDVIDRLADLGVKTLQRVPRRAVVARVPPGVDVAAVPGVRWVGEIAPRLKISRRMEAPDFEGFAVVDFFPGVAEGRIEALVEAAGGVVSQHPHLLRTSRLVYLDREAVSALSRSDEVSWIRVASDAEIAGDELFHCPGALTLQGGLASFVVHDDGWDGPGLGSAHDLLFHFVNGTADLSGDLEEAEVARAFAEWGNHAAVTYTETATPGLHRSMDVLWATGSHGDGAPFDGPGGVLAHNFYPAPPNPEPAGGDMHFDDSESWSVGSSWSGFDLFSVALHEAGHGLGLAHSDDPTAVMYPTISSSKVFHGLAPDDIAGIQEIYLPAGSTGLGFTITNSGSQTLDITSIGLDAPAPWISWSPTAPFSLAPGARGHVIVDVDFDGAPLGESVRRLLVASNDPDDSPYPGGVWVNVSNGEPVACSVGIQHLTLEAVTVDSAEVYEACDSITVGSGVVVAGPGGNLALRAPTVVLGNGFTVGIGAALSIRTELP